MFRLLSACLLAGGVLACGSAVRGTVWRDWQAALECRPCAACGAAVLWDPATGRITPCGDCRAAVGRTADRGRAWSGPAAALR